MLPAKACKFCARGWDNGRGGIACGAPVDDSDIDNGPNPIWAKRKYGRFRMLALLTGAPDPSSGIDCDNMGYNDGERCKLFEPSPDCGITEFK